MVTQENPIGTGTGILIGAAIIAAVLLFKKPAKAAAVSAESAPVPVPTPAPAPIPVRDPVTPPTPPPPPGSWVDWDGCLIKDKTYRMSVVTDSAISPAEIATVVAEMEKTGFKVLETNSAHSTLFVTAIWIALTTCEAATVMAKVFDTIQVQV